MLFMVYESAYYRIGTIQVCVQEFSTLALQLICTAPRFDQK